MCTCKSCKATANGKGFPTEPVSAAVAQRYQRAVASGSVPSDPVYAAHVRHAWSVPNREFSPAYLASKSVKVYTAPPRPESREYPQGPMSTAAYARAYYELNRRWGVWPLTVEK